MTSAWPTRYRTYHPKLYNEGVEYVLRHLVQVRSMVHRVLSLPEFGLADHIQRAYVPTSDLYPRPERFTGGGLVLVMTKRWPLEIQHPFGCQHFDGGYYSEGWDVPEKADAVLRELVTQGLRLEAVTPPQARTGAYGGLVGCSFYAIRGIGDEEGQRLDFQSGAWSASGVHACDVAMHYRRAVADFGID